VKYERDDQGNVVGVEMSVQECTRLGWLFCDRNKLPAHKPLRDEILRHQKAYSDELDARVAAEDAEFRYAGKAGGGGRPESAAELRERLAKFDQAAADRKKRSRGDNRSVFG